MPISNIEFEVRKKALEVLKTQGFKLVVSTQDAEEFSEESPERTWTVQCPFVLRIYQSREDRLAQNRTVSFSQIRLDFNTTWEKPNRAWYNYHSIHFSIDDENTVFGLRKGRGKKQLIQGVPALIQTQLEKGTYVLTLESESQDFLDLQDHAGFTCLKKDRKALIDGVKHMKGDEKVPFDYTKLPSEELPWIIECCGRNPEYQLWEARTSHANFWRVVYRNSNNLENFNDLITGA